MRSLGARLLTGMIGSMALLLLLFGITLYVTIRRALIREFDAALANSAHVMAACVDAEDDEIEIEFDPARVPELLSTELPSYFQFWAEDGAVLVRSESLGQADLPRFHGERGEPTLRRIALDGGEPARALGIRFAPAVEVEYSIDGTQSRSAESVPRVTLVVAQSTRRLDGQLAFFAWLLAGSGGVTMVAALLISFLLSLIHI